MKKYILSLIPMLLVMILLCVIGTYSFFNLIGGSVYLTVTIFVLSFTGLIFIVMFLVGDIVWKIVLKLVELWKEENQ